ncbi:MAG: hypothetical protein WAO08_32130, partial [Hyphomicrobiaceae bacterium]
MTETLERNKRTVTQFYDLMFKQQIAGCQHARNPRCETGSHPILARAVNRRRWVDGRLRRGRGETWHGTAGLGCFDVPPAFRWAILAERRLLSLILLHGAEYTDRLP